MEGSSPVTEALHPVCTDRLTRLPFTILRTLIPYNKVLDFYHLALCSKRLFSLLADKYVAPPYYIQEATFLSEPVCIGDFADLICAEEVADPSTFRVITSQRPEFVNLFHIDPETHAFFSLFNDCILEGLITRDIELVRKRPGIQQAKVATVWNSIVVCASQIELAVSFPSNRLNSIRFSTIDEPKSIKIVKNGETIILHKTFSVEVYSISLELIKNIDVPNKVSSVYVSDVSELMIAVIDADYTYRSYNVREAEVVLALCHYNFGCWKFKAAKVFIHPQNVKMMLVLLKSGSLILNEDTFRSGKDGYFDAKLEGSVIVAAAKEVVHVFALNSSLTQFAICHEFAVPFAVLSPMFFHMWRVTAIFVLSKKAVWCRKGIGGSMEPFFECNVAEDLQCVSVHGKYVVLRLKNEVMVLNFRKKYYQLQQ